MIKYFGCDIIVDSSYFVDTYIETLLNRVISAGILCAKKITEEVAIAPIEYYDAQKFNITNLYRLYPKINESLPEFTKASNRIYAFETTISEVFAEGNYLLTVMDQILQFGQDHLNKSPVLIDHNIQCLTISDSFFLNKH